MPKEIAFQPGKFQPVVEIAQRDSGVPAPADTNFAGLEEMALATLQTATAASRGFGSVVNDPVPTSRLACIIGYVLAARNIVEQLSHLGIHTRLTTPLRSPSLTILEPIARAYAYFGHFEYEGKLYVCRDLASQLISYLFYLRYYATHEVASGEKYTVIPCTFSDIDLDLFHLNNEGEIAFGKKKPLKDYILDLVKYVQDFEPLSTDEKLSWLSQVLNISTEPSLVMFLRTARFSLAGFTAPERSTTSEPSDKHKAAMKKLFGAEYANEGDTIPVSKFTGSITNAYNLTRRVSVERSYGMKTIPLARYEGGSAAQLAQYVDDVLVSSVPLSLSDSTIAVAITTSYGTTRAYRSAPALERDQLLRELVAQSLLPVR